MRTLLSFSAAAVVLSATPAIAAPRVTSISVLGEQTGMIWNTALDSYYTAFVQHPYGVMLNEDDDFTSVHVFGDRPSNYMLTGDGYPPDTPSGNSDPAYRLTVVMTENNVSQTLTGIFDGTTSAFTALSGPVSFSGVDYTLTTFNWVRGMSNLVGSYKGSNTTYPGQSVGSFADYQGAFTLSATAAVPEPATWAMMIVGFGAVAGTIRYRRRTTHAAA